MQQAGDDLAKHYKEMAYMGIIEELKNLFSNAGITVTETKEGVERGMAGTMDPFVIMRGQKG